MSVWFGPHPAFEPQRTRVSAGMSSSFWLTHRAGSWREAMDVARRFEPGQVKSKPRVEKDGAGWLVRYEPVMLIMNHVA